MFINKLTESGFQYCDTFVYMSKGKVDLKLLNLPGFIRFYCGLFLSLGVFWLLKEKTIMQYAFNFVYVLFRSAWFVKGLIYILNPICRRSHKINTSVSLPHLHKIYNLKLR